MSSIEIMLVPGSQLEKLCDQACNKVILVAPFIKVLALERLLSKVASETELICVTRWRPEEIIAGVSDLEVWSLLEKRPYTSLWLRPDLHAKYYRADKQCLVGSANLTLTALGWVNRTNLELLVPLPANDAQLLYFEKELFAGSVQVNQAIFDQIQLAVQLLEKQYPVIEQLDDSRELNSQEDSQEVTTNDAWLPTLRNPEDLYLTYCGRLEELSTASRKAALLDLRSLPIPPALSQPVFETYVATLLLQKPLIHQIDKILEKPQRFGAVANLLTSLPCSQTNDFNPVRAWQTTMRWLKYFLPNRYTLVSSNYSEVFTRIN